MRRRIFWSTLGVATIALLLTGILVTIIGQAIVSQQTRTEMRRQAVAARSLLVDELQETEQGGRLLAALLSGRDTAEAAEARRRVQTLIGTSRRLLGTEFFDLAVVTPAGELVLLSERQRDPFGFNTDLIAAGEDQFRRIESEDGRPVLVYALPIDRAATETGPRLVVVVARESALLDFGAIVRGMVAVLALSIGLSAVAARVLSRRVSRGLDSLAAAARSLAAGELAARASVDGDDEIAAVAKIFNDTADQLQEAQERERTFLMSVGHDVRTPLTTIAGYAEMLEEGALDPDETTRIATVLSAETGRLRRLVEDLMLLARLEAREFTLNYEQVDVGAHLSELADGFRHRADAARVNLVVDIEPAVITTDADRVEQITANLLENALRYTPEAGTASLVVARNGTGVLIEVADSGSGIDPEDLPHVFDKFYVARKYRRVRPEGSGLGLSIVKELTDALDGAISATSSTSGTSIRVHIPSGGQAESAPEQQLHG